jgi:DNA-binding MarR family transcriptional regulator
MSTRRREPTDFVELFGAVRRRLTTAATLAYSELELGSLQAKLVRHIGLRGGSSQIELARATASHPTLTGRALQTLIDRGLVRRERSAKDRREYVLDLTPAGRRMRERVETVRSRVAGDIVATLDNRDLDDFERIANRILAGFGLPGDAE